MALDDAVQSRHECTGGAIPVERQRARAIKLVAQKGASIQKRWTSHLTCRKRTPKHLKQDRLGARPQSSPSLAHGFLVLPGLDETLLRRERIDDSVLQLQSHQWMMC